jgi:hypothetical protein
MLNMAIRGESNKQTCSATEMLMSAVTITAPSGPLCMREVRQIIVEEDVDHPLIGSIQPHFDVALDVVHHDDEHRLQMLHRIPRSM